ncbi:hypothetical protein NBRC116589_17890 [Ruegeria sp. HU-ET01832]
MVIVPVTQIGKRRGSYYALRSILGLYDDPVQITFRIARFLAVRQRDATRPSYPNGLYDVVTWTKASSGSAWSQISDEGPIFNNLGKDH